MVNRSFFQAAVVSILLYGCTTWTLTKLLEKKLDGNYTRMLPSNIEQVLAATPLKAPNIRPPASITCLPSKFDEPDTQDTAGEAETSSSVIYSYGPPHIAEQKQAEQFEHTYSSYVRIRDVALKICQRRWTIGRSGKRGSGISVQAARRDEDDMVKRFSIKYMWFESRTDECTTDVV